MGIDRDAVLAGSGIPLVWFTSLEARISYDQYGVLMGNALRLTGDPAFGLRVGRNINIGQMGVYALPLLTSSTMSELIRRWFEYVRALAPAWDPELELRGGRVMLRLRQAIPLRPHELFATETLLTAIDVQLRFLIQRPLPLSCLRFAYPRPAHVALYSGVYDAESRPCGNVPAGETFVGFGSCVGHVSEPDPMTATTDVIDWSVPTSGPYAQMVEVTPLPPPPPPPPPPDSGISDAGPG